MMTIVLKYILCKQMSLYGHTNVHPRAGLEVKWEDDAETTNM